MSDDGKMVKDEVICSVDAFVTIRVKFESKFKVTLSKEFDVFIYVFYVICEELNLL